MEFKTLTKKYSLFDMYLFVGIMYFINESLFMPLFIGVIGITIGAIIVDIFLYLLELYEDYKIKKMLENEDK